MELSAQVIAAFTLRERRHHSADRAEARRQLGTAAIDRRLVVGRRLDPHQRLDRLDEPVGVGAAEVLKVV